jgi:adenosylhomocysteine nucleosidase
MEVKPAPDLLNQRRTTLVCFAVKEEARVFRRAVAGRPGIRVLITGMGRRNSERAIRQALKLERPDLVLSTGFAGALNRALLTGDVLFATDENSKLAAELAVAGAKAGRFLCTQGVITTAKEKRMLSETTGADAVEMESGPICNVCRLEGVSSATVRVIIDTADEDLPLDFNQLMTEDQSLATGKLALAILRSPATIGGLLKLRTQSHIAAKRLAEVLIDFIDGGSHSV